MSNLSPAPGTPQTATKAKVALAISTLGAVLTFIVAYFPDNDNLQLWGGLVLGVLTVLASSYGVYQTPNQPTST